MASLECLEEEAERALEVSEDKSKPSYVQDAARLQFWHCFRRADALRLGGRIHDEPGHYLIGHGEIDVLRSANMNRKNRAEESALRPGTA